MVVFDVRHDSLGVESWCAFCLGSSVVYSCKEVYLSCVSEVGSDDVVVPCFFGVVCGGRDVLEAISVLQKRIVCTENKVQPYSRTHLIYPAPKSVAQQRRCYPHGLEATRGRK